MKSRHLLALALIVSLVPAGGSHYATDPARRFAPEAGEKANSVSFPNLFVSDTRSGESALTEHLRIDESSTDKPVVVLPPAAEPSAVCPRTFVALVKLGDRRVFASQEAT